MKALRMILLLVVIGPAISGIARGQDFDRWGQLYNQIKDIPFDESKVALVESLVLRRDVAVFRLNEGRIHLFEPVGGRIIGAVFVGEGVFEFSPPTEIERYQLKRFTEHESLSEEFEKLCMLFSDSTGMELERVLSFSAAEMVTAPEFLRKDAPRRFLKETGGNLWARVLGDILADSSYLTSHPDRADGFFYADIETKDLGRLFLTFDPKEVEEVTLEKPDPRPGVDARDLVCAFHRTEDYQKSPTEKYTPIPHEDKDEIKVTHYTMDVKIDIKEEMAAIVEMDFECLTDGARVIDFDLVPHQDLVMERITDEQGDSLYFVREKKDQSGVCVFLPRPTESGQMRRLTFRYWGKEMILQDSGGDLYIRSTTRWYPRYGFNKKATYDMTFRSPRGYQLVSIGKKEKEWVEGDFRCTHWVEEYPVAMASFNYGNYETYELEAPGIPPVTVYHLEQSHRGTGVKYKKIKENVAADVVNSLNFFQGMFGKYPFCKMAATETASYGGQGLPGLLRLSWSTFLGDDGVQEWRFWDESFRAHEVSHQWWGHIIGWEGYHDQWLSEGFAEYSGAWYAQMSMQDNEEFFEELKEWRKDIMGKGYKWAEGSKVGPIWLGRRLDSSKSDDYGTLIYEKGAYILHMLRNMMMDYDSKSDERFKEMMRDFAQTYQGKNACTEDFKEIVEKHMDEDMDWFFDQWVYGVDIPTYVFSYSTQNVGDKYVVTCEVAQENVPEDFKMWVPVLVDFGRDTYAVLRLWVDKPHNEYQLPKAPLEPRQVILNPFHAALCEVKYK
jgi:hypothetical protein